jgi:hypothetical protein
MHACMLFQRSWKDATNGVGKMQPTELERCKQRSWKNAVPTELERCNQQSWKQSLMQPTESNRFTPMLMEPKGGRPREGGGSESL